MEIIDTTLEESAKYIHIYTHMPGIAIISV